MEPARVAQGYEIGGAAALSVLTEEQFFGGSLEDLKECRQATLLPTLRKDFIVDAYQVWESLMSGADAILLIVAALEDGQLSDLYGTAQEAGLECLVEVHDERELERALRVDASHHRGEQPRPADHDRRPPAGVRADPGHPGRTWWPWRRAASAGRRRCGGCARSATTRSWSASTSCWARTPRTPWRS